MAEDPYITGPKSRAERKAEADAKAESDAAEHGKRRRKWYEILQDTIVPQKGLIEGAARKIDEATKR